MFVDNLASVRSTERKKAVFSACFCEEIVLPESYTFRNIDRLVFTE